MNDKPERKRPKAPTPKGKRAPVPARKRGAPVRAPKKGGRARGAPPPSSDSPGEDIVTPEDAAQQAAAQQQAAQQAAAQQQAAQQAAAQKAAQQKAAQQKAAQQQAAQQKAAQQKAAQQKAAQQKAAQQQAAQQQAAQQQAAQQQAAQQAAAQRAAQEKAQRQAAAAAAAAQKAAAAAQKAAEEAAALQAAAEKSALAATPPAPPESAPPRAVQPAPAPPKPAAKTPTPRRSAPKRAAPKKSAPARRAPGGGTPQRSAPAASPKQRAGDRRAAAPSGTRPAAASRTRAPGRSGAPTRGARAGHPKGVRATARAKAHHDAGLENFEDFQPDSKSNSKALWYGIAAAAVLVGCIVLILPPSSEVPPKVVEVVPEAPPVDPKVSASEKALARAKDYQKAEPTEYAEQVSMYEWVDLSFPGYPAGLEARKLGSEVKDQWRAEVNSERSRLEEKIGNHRAKYEYAEALSFLDEPAPVFEYADEYFEEENSVLGWIKRERRELKLLADAYQRLKELELKAAQYAEYEDIAIAILQAFPDKFEEDAIPVWMLKEETMARIRSEGLKMWLEGVAASESAREAAELAAREEEERQRRERWASMKDSVSWFPHLGKYNLYNWVASSDARRQDPQWKLALRDEGPVLKGSNSGGNDMWIGPYTNHWRDYVLEFEMKLSEGALHLSPRTVVQQGFPSDESTRMEFSEDTGIRKGRWTKVTIEVNGDSVVAEIDGAPPVTVDPDTNRILRAGGFLFFVADGARVELRRIQSKLINSTRDSKN